VKYIDVVPGQAGLFQELVADFSIEIGYPN